MSAMQQVLGHPAAPRAMRQSVTFFRALAGVTALPLLTLGFAALWFHQYQTNIAVSIYAVTFATGIGHVCLTSQFYVDREFSALIRANKVRFVIIPAVILALTIIVSVINGSIPLVIMMAFFSWQLYHFQRQNYGIIHFVAKSSGCNAVPDGLNFMLNAAVAAGVLLSWSAVRHDLGIPFMAVAGYAGRLLYVIATISLIRLLLLNPLITRYPRVLFFIVMGWGFFLPTLIPAAPVLVYWSYAIAHGAQYILFMFYIFNGNVDSQGRALVLAKVLAILGVVCLASVYCSTAVMLPVTIGLTMGHFVVDAKIWRMREPAQRSLMQKRFAFLFHADPTSSEAAQ